MEVKDGIVTLAGHVGSYAEKWAAERAAQRVCGVKALAIEMDIKLSESDKRNDVDIALSARSVLQWMIFLPKDAIHIMVEHGWVTLSGEVEWEYQRKIAIYSISHLRGVTGISNNMTLKLVLSSKNIKADIEAAFKRRIHVDAQNISVEINDCDVTLTGNICGWSERELAKHAVWSIPGVRNVIDKMTVNYK